MLLSPEIANLFYDRGATLREKTGLLLPNAARIRDFHYAEGLRGDGMSLSFDTTDGQARSFLEQEPLFDAKWEDKDDRLFDEMEKPKDPKGLYRSATIQPSPREWIDVDAKDRKDGTWTIWVRWGDE